MTSNEIKQRYSMAEVVAGYGIRPNKSGYIKCPFHAEKTASMRINADFYHCFGCGEHGDIFSFVQKMENISFSEAFIQLGGLYEASDRKIAAVRISKTKRKIEEKIREDAIFCEWKRKRLDQACKLLREYDKLTSLYMPFSDEWTIVFNNKQHQEYCYSILVYGSREEQEEMRTADG